jgi:hypothetical protein
MGEHIIVEQALARWQAGRLEWEAAGCRVEDWQELVGRWADAYDDAVRRMLDLHAAGANRRGEAA